MSISSSTQVALRGVTFAAVAVCLQLSFVPSSGAQNTPTQTSSGIHQQLSSVNSQSARMATFDLAGEINFALSLNAKFDSSDQRASDIVVYVDTSASQSGAFKRDSIATVEHLLSHLNADDRIKIVAVDLDPVPLTRSFVSPASDEVQVALEKLNQRVALGSTDVELMLNSAAQEFSGSTDRNRNVIYIGDGICRGGILHTDAFATAVNRLVQNQVSVSSYAIGPKRNIELMASLANHTGGNLFVDSNEPAATRDGARGLAQSVHGSVFWPKSNQVSDTVVEFYPSNVPPLRSDRDSILIGSLAQRNDMEIQLTGSVNGSEETWNWKIQPEASSENFAFVSALIRDARGDGGLTLPTVGSEGLRESARLLAADAERLAELGNQALLTGNENAAQQLAVAALKSNPQNDTANAVSMMVNYPIQEDDPFGLGGDDAAVAPGPVAQEDNPFGAAPAQPAQVEEPFGADPADANAVAPEEMPNDVAPADDGAAKMPGQEQPGQAPVVQTDDPGSLRMIAQKNEDAADRLLLEARQEGQNLVASQAHELQVINERAQKQVQFELKRSREEIKVDPNAAITRLKNVIEIIDNTPDLFPETRQQLRLELESALLTARREKLEFDERLALANVNESIARQRERETARLIREEEQLAELIGRFNTLMEEENYDAAKSVTAAALEIAPEFPHVITADETARVARNLKLSEEVRRMKAENFQASLYLVQKASISFPGDPPLVFPDPEEWLRKKKRREKYQNMRLTGSENDEKILQALEEPANLEYDETPWNEIEEELEREYRFNIVLDQSAIDDSLSEEEPVTVNLRGIRLKNALRLMLKKYNATYIVRDEVLLIISLDDAEDVSYFVNNVYNVGDLVAPRSNSSGGVLGGLGTGGLGGGGQGGGGGGFGGGQGGGGFGGGQGGGGGVFCIQENPVLRLQANPSARTPVASPAEQNRSTSSRRRDLSQVTDWNAHFAANFADPASVRKSVRDLMKDDQPQEVVELIQAAIQHDQFQPWMHQAMVLAMQIAGMPKSDIERALMSAVDLSDDPNDAMYAAQYMAVNGMEKRALRILKDFAKANPTRTEPLVIGLRAAQRIDDIDGIQWATVGIFSQEWPDHPDIVKQARYAADAIRLQLRNEGKKQELAKYEQQLAAAMERDCFINVSWTGDADIDLFVAEPGGTICSRMQPRTEGGGVAMGDQFSQGADKSGVVSEQYVLPKGFAGNYQLLVRRVWGEVTSGKVTVSIHNHYRSPREASMTKQVELDDKGAIVLFALDEGRRQEPLEEHAIATVVKQQLATNRNILAQQIPGTGDSLASYYGGSDYDGTDDVGGGLIAGGGNPALNNLLNNSLRQSAVGYQPTISLIPEGTFLTVNHATTADRLYVNISVSPTFSQISSVSTFNILGDADTASGITGGGGGGGGGTGGTGGF